MILVIPLSWMSRGWIPDRVVDWLGVIAGALLVAYLVNLFVKMRRPDADSSAKGCIGFVALLTGLLLVLLIVGLVFHVRLLTLAVAAITEVTLLFLAPEIVRMVIRDWRNK
jgi:hypothetical protein